MKINRLMTNIGSNDFDQSKCFYLSLFDLKVNYDSDWFVHLVSEDGQFEMGIIKTDNDLVPMGYRGKPAGVYLTMVVDDVDAAFKVATEKNMTILQEPQLTFYGQKRLLLEDPSGVLVDISSPAA